MEKSKFLIKSTVNIDQNENVYDNCRDIKNGRNKTKSRNDVK